MVFFFFLIINTDSNTIKFLVYHVLKFSLDFACLSSHSHPSPGPGAVTQYLRKPAAPFSPSKYLRVLQVEIQQQVPQPQPLHGSSPSQLCSRKSKSYDLLVENLQQLLTVLKAPDFECLSGLSFVFRSIGIDSGMHECVFHLHPRLNVKVAAPGHQCACQRSFLRMCPQRLQSRGGFCRWAKLLDLQSMPRTFSISIWMSEAVFHQGNHFRRCTDRLETV